MQTSKPFPTYALEEVCTMYQPQTISTKEMVPDGPYPVFGANGEIGRYDRFNHESPQLLITCRGATCGSVNISHPYSWITGNAMVVRPNEKWADRIHLRFLQYIFSGVIDLSSAITGAAQPQITRTSLNPLRIPVPPLAEQERVIALLDETFTGIDQAKANAQRNLENAKELFQTLLASQFPSHWPRTRLGDHAEFRNGVNFSRDSNGHTVKVVGVGDFQNRFWIPTDALETKTLDGPLDPQDRVAQDDFLFVRSNGNRQLIGRCMLAGPVSEHITHSGFTIRMRLTNTKFLPSFLCWYFKSSSARTSLVGSGAGAQISNLNQGTLASLLVPAPSILDQQATIDSLDAYANETQRLEAVHQRELNALEELKQSILHRAFTPPN